MRKKIVKYLVLVVLVTLFIGSCTNSYKVIETNSSNDTVNSELLTTDSLYVLTKPYRDQLEDRMNEVLNQSSVDLIVGVPEGTMNNFIADLVLQRAKIESASGVDVSIINNGGLRIPILKGDVTRGMLYELMPFENELHVAELSGDQMVDLINYIADRNSKGEVRIATSFAGMKIEIVNGEVSRVSIGEDEFDTNKTYRVVTTDYLIGGGDEMNFFEHAVGFEDLKLKLRDIIIEHVISEKKEGRLLNSELDGRIYIAE